jgi:hypothetical protein
MSFAALQIGFGVPDAPFAASVRSLFRNACILAVDGAGLVTIAPKAAGGLPGGITVDVPTGFDFERALQSGARAAARGGVLRVEASAFAVDLRAAAPWRAALTGLRLTLSRPAVQSAWKRCATILAKDGRADTLIEIARNPIDALLFATRGLESASAGAAARALIGLGAGGTPAGDDFLVGFLAGLWSAADGAEGQAFFIAEFARRIRAEAHRTTEVSRVYLEAVAAGEVSERLADLAKAIAAGASEEIVTATAAAAIAVGHSSGADGTLGLLCGAASWGPAGFVPLAAGLLAGSAPAPA